MVLLHRVFLFPKRRVCDGSVLHSGLDAKMQGVCYRGGKTGLAGNKGSGKWNQGFSLMIVVQSWCIERNGNTVQLYSFSVGNINQIESNINIYQLFLHFCSFWFHIQPHRSLPIDPPVREPRTRGVDATGRETHLQGGTGRIWRCTVWSVCGGIANLWDLCTHFVEIQYIRYCVPVYPLEGE